MAKVYAELIRKGLKTLENVPKTLQAEVQELLKNEQLFLLPCKNFLPEGGVYMAVVYATLIVKGKKTIAQVPELLKAQVQEILDALEVQ